MGIKSVNNRSFGENFIIDAKSSMDAGLNMFPTKPAWWVHPDSGFTLGGGNEVSQWNDASGNGNHLVQGTGALQPTWTAAQLNGYPGVIFNGDILSTAGTVPVTATDSTVFIVAAGLSAVNYRPIIAFGDTYLNYFIDHTITNTSEIWMGGSTISNAWPGTATFSFTIFSCIKVAGKIVNFFINADNKINLLSHGTYVAQTIQIGVTAYPAYCNVVEEIAFPKAFSYNQTMAVYANLKAKYAL